MSNISEGSFQQILSEKLAALDVDDVRGRSARYAALREARDVQDVVFGAG